MFANGAPKSSESNSPRWVRALMAVEAGALAGVAILGGIILWNSQHAAVAPAPFGEARQISLYPWGVVSAYTFYIVGSEAEAAELRTALEAGNNVRHALGEDLLQEKVIVASDAGQAGEITRAIDEGNLILAAFQAEDRVVNLVDRI